jgi:hypothetical protein
MKKIISINKQGYEKVIGHYELFSTNNKGYYHILDSNKKAWRKK